MPRVKVAVNGYGTIGKRVAEAVAKMPDMELVGIAKYSLDYGAFLASKAGIRIFTKNDMIEVFEKKGVRVFGTIDDLLRSADIVVDSSPAGKGRENKKVYEALGVKAVFQGGEKPDVADVSFSTYCNYEEALGKKYVRVVSCNTTALLRLLCLIDKRIGVRKAQAVIVRRAGDPKEDKGLVNSIKLDPASIPSHHAEDAKSVVPRLDVVTVGLVAPTTLMHVHIVTVRLKRNTSLEEVLELLSSSRRFVVLDAKLTGIDSTGKIIEAARDAGRKRYDLYENVVWRDMIRVSGDELTLVQAVHQEAIVIPENIDAIRASALLSSSGEESARLTDGALGLGLKFD